MISSRHKQGKIPSLSVLPGCSHCSTPPLQVADPDSLQFLSAHS
jgi:hypothetical protein